MVSSQEDVLSDGQRGVELHRPTVEGGRRSFRNGNVGLGGFFSVLHFLPQKYERERVRRHLTRCYWTEKRIAEL